MTEGIEHDPRDPSAGASDSHGSSARTDRRATACRGVRVTVLTAWSGTQYFLLTSSAGEHDLRTGVGLCLFTAVFLTLCTCFVISVDHAGSTTKHIGYLAGLLAILISIPSAGITVVPFGSATGPWEFLISGLIIDSGAIAA